MNEKKAKKIRRVVGFTPSAAREYKDLGAPASRVVAGQLVPVVLTRESTGPRREYRIAKRTAQKMRLA